MWYKVKWFIRWHVSKCNITQSWQILSIASKWGKKNYGAKMNDNHVFLNFRSAFCFGRFISTVLQSLVISLIHTVESCLTVWTLCTLSTPWISMLYNLIWIFIFIFASAHLDLLWFTLFRSCILMFIAYYYVILW